MAMPLRFSAQAPSSRLEEIVPTSDRIEELSDSELGSEYEDMGTATVEEQANIVYLDSIRIPIKDTLETATSEVDEETARLILPYLEGNPNDFDLNAFGIPKLQRQRHEAMLKKILGDYPSGAAAMDAARPWLVYWALQSMTALGQDISSYHKRIAHTFSLVQHPDGGFGGGYGQYAHLACSYAATLSLAIAGGKDSYDVINRKTLWHYLGRMKQADGGFTMCLGGEEDIRGAYCAMVILSLTNLPMELPPDAPARKHGLTSFTDGLGEWVSKCQSWDGGISAEPGNEAHGAYAFCGLACLSILGPPKETLHKYLNIDMLIYWLSSRQCTPEGGYNGRTNKLVDGCYSHWVGGCWSIVEAVTTSGLWNRPALGRYILAACQEKKGGLKDKPGKSSDAYHTCYNLAGLSAAQYKYAFDENVNKNLGATNFGAPYHWKSEGRYEDDKIVWDDGDIVKPVHPIFVIPFMSVYEMRKYFEDKEGF
ncbi:CAL1 Prenyltransferase beta subunit [Pyrenophora tritici-repentis]|uniref:Protein farnesyltransferase subunit beta n=2 Tax=Pyrenophora tritici-repentis TaxID=45151 RepID=A0A2W1F6I8_9PLEO|nr:CaaX farnesyltransferase beta subunit Ram1 [Pyrenophora tritici-repentis Pt-1C-BFP]KAA8626156.1 farnesyltransferase beta subunit ram1 [Pyrenophora tritici-repentis]EDU40933.1 CaaX farnesyltransferase beta subunit Ram1 [Pyrenophora tritici-repentis Pt-1C-BFP]KAF7454570.1 farnesyltransferase beta protein [Pyrenophora tritici-repentis]KAF7577692.1 CAL1, Prenyltransferase, beta subunit [Pyrenophora tritici-repentis]KAG9388320.1 farnesyltransferase beta protein [Pyrenophora tritici-repentis]